MAHVVDETYLPFTDDELRPHFIADVEGQIAYYRKSADRYHEFLSEHPDTSGIPLTRARAPRQIETDERFWTITALKRLFDDSSRDSLLTALLKETFGDAPPVPGLGSWRECLSGDLRLYFEACLPSPPSYVEWLRTNLPSQQVVPYVRDAARRESARTLEGATHVDALFLNLSNGFAWLIEAKVLSDVSYSISFDSYRNQIARNLDVMLDNMSQPGAGLEARNPSRSLFALLTPGGFKRNPSSRLYGWLIQEYQSDPKSLRRDLGHRNEFDWTGLSKRIGWFTFDDVEKLRPGTCTWPL
ncbi:MAG: hypothetical protein ABIE42_09545 [Candidatus Eisenbacteria bacterium]